LFTEGPLAGITPPLIELKNDYYRAMGWNPETGYLSRVRAEQLGIGQLLAGYVEA
jgi:hypothetical protein